MLPSKSWLWLSHIPSLPARAFCLVAWLGTL